ncbi:MAG: RtcB family protein [Chloroflexi bacterium]|mgnify:CR=1 FL=1|nr:RtcB family protein [Chloroflexota bacterium]
MVQKRDLKRLSDYLYEIPTSLRSDMRVPARIYADDKLLEMALEDRAVEQLVNTTTLPGIVRYALAMPDIHQGYGFSIGGVAATKLPDGVISPGGVGYDINCGVRLLASNLTRDEVAPHVGALMNAVYRRVPSGVGQGGALKLSERDMDEVLERGASWVVDKLGYGTREDLERTEERGSMAGGEARHVSKQARDRARGQLGTLGSGNHFLEIDQVVEIYDQAAADAYGLYPGRIAVQIHSGSRALGHQVCTDYVRRLQQAAAQYGIKLPDRELACVPFDSPEGKAYFGAMVCAANYAWANRQVMAHQVRQAFDDVLAGKVNRRELSMVYDVAHNIAKVETYPVEGQPTRLCVHRKGATRSLGPGGQGLPDAYREIGQPVLIPGSMGTASYVLAGTRKAMEESFGSTCHGAGRVLSRQSAKRQVRGDELRAELERQGIAVRAGSMPGLAEEAPDAYKDIDLVVEVVHGAGLSRKVARLEPLGVMKG